MNGQERLKHRAAIKWKLLKHCLQSSKFYIAMDCEVAIQKGISCSTPSSITKVYSYPKESLLEESFMVSYSPAL